MLDYLLLLTGIIDGLCYEYNDQIYFDKDNDTFKLRVQTSIFIKQRQKVMNEIFLNLMKEWKMIAIYRCQRPYHPPTPMTRHSILQIRDDELYVLTGFKLKDHLKCLLKQWRIPKRITTFGSVFSGEEIMIVSLAKYSIGDSWIRLIRSWFGGHEDKWCGAFGWFVRHLFFTFYQCVCGDSLRRWVTSIPYFQKNLQKG